MTTANVLPIVTYLSVKKKIPIPMKTFFNLTVYGRKRKPWKRNTIPRYRMINEQNNGQITQLFCERPDEAIKMKISHNPVTFCTVNYFPLLSFAVS